MLVSGSSRNSAIGLQLSSLVPSQEISRNILDERTAGNSPTVSLDPAYGSKLADALWSMESKGVLLDQKPNRIALNKEEQNDKGDEFLKVSKMTPAERIRYFFLKDRELNEDMLAAMSQRDREAIEDQIKEIILQQLGLEDEDGKPDDAPAAAPQGPPTPIDSV